MVLLYLSGREQSGVIGAGGLGEGMMLEVEVGLAEIICSQGSAVGMLKVKLCYACCGQRTLTKQFLCHQKNKPQKRRLQEDFQ